MYGRLGGTLFSGESESGIAIAGEPPLASYKATILQVELIKVCYWGDSAGAYDVQANMPCMICEDHKGQHFYAMPSNEYPGLFKVGMQANF